MSRLALSLLLPVCLCCNQVAHAEIGAFLKPGDERIYLHGDGNPNELLAGVEIRSAGGYLSRAGYEAAPGVILPNQSHDPFPFGGSSFFSETPNQYSYGVLGAENSILVTGVVPTGILYSTEADRNDLVVNLGISGPPFGCAVNETTSKTVNVRFDPEPDNLPFFQCFSFGKSLLSDEMLHQRNAIGLFSSGPEITLTGFQMSGDAVFDIPDFAQVVLGPSPTEASSFDLILDAREAGPYSAVITFLGQDAGGNQVESTWVTVYGQVLAAELLADCNVDGKVDSGDLVCARGMAAEHVLVITGTQPGDLNGDGSVGFDDFQTLSANFGPRIWYGANLTSYGDGDVNVNGEVDFADFLILSGNFNQVDLAAVPEPSTGLMAVLGFAGLLGLRRRR